MVRWLAHLDDNHHHCSNERNRHRDLPTGRVQRDGCRSQNDKHSSPRKLKRPRHAHDIAEQEEMSEHEADHESPPPDCCRERERGRHTDDEDDHVEHRQPEPWSEGVLCIAVEHRSLVRRNVYGSPRHQRMLKPRAAVRSVYTTAKTRYRRAARRYTSGSVYAPPYSSASHMCRL